MLCSQLRGYSVVYPQHLFLPQPGQFILITIIGRLCLDLNLGIIRTLVIEDLHFLRFVHGCKNSPSSADADKKEKAPFKEEFHVDSWERQGIMKRVLP